MVAVLELALVPDLEPSESDAEVALHSEVPDDEVAVAAVVAVVAAVLFELVAEVAVTVAGA